MIEKGVRRVGCAGWSISSQAAALFPGTGSHLERFAQVFNTVEINSSFYRPHRPQTYARWAASVPAAFRFSVKLPRSITHDQRLQDIDPLVARFADEVGALDDKLGCILIQLPPSLAFDVAVADAFFKKMCTGSAGPFDCTLAVEARHATWFDAAATSILQQYGVTRVIADPAVGQPGAHIPTTSDIYLRLHGSPRRYYSTYSQNYLAQLDADMQIHANAGRTVWCIFDNTLSPTYLQQALAVTGATDHQ